MAEVPRIPSMLGRALLQGGNTDPTYAQDMMGVAQAAPYGGVANPGAYTQALDPMSQPLYAYDQMQQQDPMMMQQSPLMGQMPPQQMPPEMAMLTPEQQAQLQANAAQSRGRMGAFSIGEIAAGRQENAAKLLSGMYSGDVNQLYRMAQQQRLQQQKNFTDQVSDQQKLQSASEKLYKSMQAFEDPEAVVEFDALFPELDSWDKIRNAQSYVARVRSKYVANKARTEYWEGFMKYLGQAEGTLGDIPDWYLRGAEAKYPEMVQDMKDEFGRRKEYMGKVEEHKSKLLEQQAALNAMAIKRGASKGTLGKIAFIRKQILMEERAAKSSKEKMGRYAWDPQFELENLMGLQKLYKELDALEDLVMRDEGEGGGSAGGTKRTVTLGAPGTAKLLGEGDEATTGGGGGSLFKPSVMDEYY